jgi:hypothetical protein
LGVDDVLLVALPDTEVSGGWAIDFVSVQDLFIENPDELLDEGISASAEGNFELENCKRHAYLAVTGMTDTK